MFRTLHNTALSAAVALACLQCSSAHGEAAAPLVVLAELENQAISPGTTRYLDRALREATRQNAACLVIVLDTPGGLLDSTRYLVKQILASEVPVVVYVAPSGSRAASAGMFIALAAHVAAMAPGTTIGAAHPVQVGSLPASPEPDDDADDGRSPAVEKIVNDTVAWAEALAALRERNTELAASAVRQSVSVVAAEAEKQGLVDLVARDLTELLEKIDGRTVELPTGTRSLETAGAATHTVAMWWGESLLATIAHPNVAFLLMIFGFYGILFELYSPGWGVAGTLGVLCMLLGMFGLAVLPVNYLGFALILAALALFAAEIFVTSYGALAVAGTVCLILGGMMLVDSPAGFSRVSLAVVVPVAAATAIVVLILAAGVLRAHRGRVRTGAEELIGAPARSIDSFATHNGQYVGDVRVHGERWKAVSLQPIQEGQTCRVTHREGLTLTVEPEEHTQPTTT